MKKILLCTTLAASTVLAQTDGTIVRFRDLNNVDSGTIRAGTLILTGPQNSSTVVETTPGTGVQSYYVDNALGNDSNLCTSSGAGNACRTIPAVMKKIPKLLRDQVTITMADDHDGGTANYGCFYISGYTADTTIQQNNSGMYFTGTLLTATGLASGSATGTSTAGSAGSGATYGTLTDGAATWTTNDLRGRLILIGASEFMISSNTSTVITTVGNCSTCAGSVVYTIQKPGWALNTACVSPPTPVGAGGANACSICINDNNVNTALSNPGGFNVHSVVIENVGFSAATAPGVTISGPGSYRIRQFMKTTGTGSLLSLGVTNTLAAVALSVGSNTGGTNSAMVAQGYNGNLELRESNVLAYGSNRGLVNATSISHEGASIIINNSEATNSTTAGVSVASGLVSATGVRIDCTAATGSAMILGAEPSNLVQNTVSGGAVTGSISSSVLGPTCGNGVFLNGATANAVVENTYITGNNNGVLANLGGSFLEINYDGGAMVLIADGGSATQFNLDNGGTKGAQSDVDATSCISTATFESKFCN